MVRVVDFNADNIKKKLILREHYPSCHTKRPFVVAYPYGPVDYKHKHKRIFHAHDTLDDLLEYTSKGIGDNTTHVDKFTFSTVTQNTFRGGKGILVLFHNEETSSMSFRTLARNKSFTSDFNFVTFKNPDEEFLKQVGVVKIPSIVFIRPKMDSFFNIDQAESMITVEYAGRFFYQ
jgi:hypothetical protein